MGRLSVRKHIRRGGKGEGRERGVGERGWGRDGERDKGWGEG